MEQAPLLFDLGPTPTTRDVARLVKDGGAAALTEAERRADEATYQEIRCRSALNRVKGMPFKWTLNPYRGCTHGCHYCFARRYQSQLELGAGRRLLVDDLRQDQLRGRAAARARRSRRGAREMVALGTATDPYQPIEGTYKHHARRARGAARRRAPRPASSPRAR